MVDRLDARKVTLRPQLEVQEAIRAIARLAGLVVRAADQQVVEAARVALLQARMVMRITGVPEQRVGGAVVRNARRDDLGRVRCLLGVQDEAVVDW
jgi:hypothetical protein